MNKCLICNGETKKIKVQEIDFGKIEDAFKCLECGHIYIK